MFSAALTAVLLAGEYRAAGAVAGLVALAELAAWGAWRRARSSLLALGAEPHPDIPLAYTRCTWTSLPLHVDLRHGRALRSLNVDAGRPFYYTIACKAAKIEDMVSKGGLSAATSLYLRASKKQQVESHCSWWGQPWLVTMTVGMPAGQERALKVHNDADRPSQKFDIRKESWLLGSKDRGYFWGVEIAEAWRIPKELGSSIDLRVPVEMHAPAHLDPGIGIGRVIDPETMLAVAPAGFLPGHLVGGLGILGGTWQQRENMLDLVASRCRARVKVYIDLEGTLRLPGARRYRVYAAHGGMTLNVFVPPGTGDLPSSSLPVAASEHVKLLGAVLSILHGLSAESEALFVGAVQRNIATLAAGGLKPEISTITNDIKQNGGYRGSDVIAAIEASLSSASIPWQSIEDMPRFDASLLDADVVLDLGLARGDDRKLMAGVLLVKLFALIRSERRDDVLACIPALDSIFPLGTARSGAGGGGAGSRQERAMLDIARFILGSPAMVAFTVQQPSRLPEQLLVSVPSLVAFKQGARDNADAVAGAMGLEGDQLYSSSRHASYQVAYLRDMPAGQAYVLRPDYPRAFLVETGQAPAMRGDMPVPAAGEVIEVDEKGLLDQFLRGFDVAREDVPGVLATLARLDGHPVKQKDVITLFEAMFAKGYQRDGDLPAKVAGSRAKESAERLYGTLVGHGVIAETTAGSASLKSELLVKITAFGKRVLDMDAGIGGDAAAGTRQRPEGVPDPARALLDRIHEARLRAAALENTTSAEDHARYVYGAVRDISVALRDTAGITPALEAELQGLPADLRALDGLLRRRGGILDVDPGEFAGRARAVLVYLDAIEEYLRTVLEP